MKGCISKYSNLSKNTKYIRINAKCFRKGFQLFAIYRAFYPAIIRHFTASGCTNRQSYHSAAGNRSGSQCRQNRAGDFRRILRFSSLGSGRLFLGTTAASFYIFPQIYGKRSRDYRSLHGRRFHKSANRCSSAKSRLDPYAEVSQVL